ncbi:MAG: TolC family protein [Candidatus Omnitrophota bacterium]|nr:TolC family protein [Candidatus Omnitrophota bacterium]
MFKKFLSIIFICVIYLNMGVGILYAEEEILSWNDCVREAAKNHPDLIAAEEVVKQNQANTHIVSSAIYPQVNSSLTAATSRSDSGNGASVGDAYNYGLSASQLIFDGAKTLNNINAAGETLNASKQGYRFASTTVRYNLRSAFINLLNAQENLNITRQIFEIRRSNLELITLRYESGLEHKGALLTAEADLAQANYSMAQAQRNVGVAQGQLTQQLGRLKLVPMRVLGDFQVRETAENKPVFETLIKNNPSLLQLDAQKKSAAFALKSAYANFSPTLTGSAGANNNGAKWTPKSNQWNMGLSVSMPIFEGGLRFAQVDQARGVLNQLIANEKSTRDNLIYALEQSWAALQDAVDNVGVQKLNLTATEERSKIAQAQYSIGFISFDNWTIIENNLVTAKQKFLAAQAAALSAEAAWIKAKGETLEYE